MLGNVKINKKEPFNKKTFKIYSIRQQQQKLELPDACS
jgi:hypothetical protein